MTKYFIDNWIPIASLLTALLAIIVPTYYQYHRKKSKQNSISEVPKTLIIVLSDYQDKIRTVEEQNSQLKRELENVKLLPYNSYDFNSNAQLETKIEQIIKNSSVKNIDSEIRDLINEVLAEKEYKIEDLFQNNEQYKSITNFFYTYPFKQKIAKYLVHAYLNAENSEQTQYKASLLWVYTMEKDSVPLFAADRLKSPSLSEPNVSNEEIVEYFWNIVNIGYAYHTYNIYIEDRNVFKQKFENALSNELIGTTFSYLNHPNPQIVQAASWSLVWLVNAKSDVSNDLWKFSEIHVNDLCKTFANAKKIETIKSIMRLLNYSFSTTSAYKGNFAYDCANAIDNNTVLSEVAYESINVEVCKIIYSKYLVTPDEVKIFLTKYLAMYGFKDLSIASRLLTFSLKDKEINFILFTLLPYISLMADKSLISYASEWLNSDDKSTQFYGLLFQKVLEKVSKDVLDFITDNEYSVTSLNQMKITNSLELDLFDRKKSTVLYKVIRLMYGHCHKLKAKDSTGRWAWYVVLVTPENEKSFLKAIEGDGTIDLEDFGKVIVSAYGDQTPDNLDDLIFSQYS